MSSHGFTVRSLICLSVCVLWFLCLTPPSPVFAYDPSKYDVEWTTPSDLETQSMPLGNGDLTMNVWLDSSTADLMYYAQSSSAWDENGQLLKLIRGRLHINTTASQRPTVSGFSQRLHIATASQSLSYDLGAVHVEVLVWIDRYHPVVHFTVQTSTAVSAVNSIEIWRTVPTLIDGWTGGYYCDDRYVYPDVLYNGTGWGGGTGELLWYHRNDGDEGNRYYDSALKRQSLDGIGLEELNPLVNRTFGGYISHRDTAVGHWTTARVTRTSYGLSAAVSSKAPLAAIAFDLYSHTERSASVGEFQTQFQLAVEDILTVPLATAWAAHVAYWSDFLNRSYVELTVGTDSAVSYRLNQQLLLQRVTDAMNGLNESPIHFNGQGWSIGSNDRQGPDARGWGSAFWWQNIREPYYAAVQAGDMDVLRAMFDFYKRLLPVQEARVQAYYGHAGAYYDETVMVYGLMTDAGFGYTCDGTEKLHGNTYIRFHWDGSLELCLLMVSYWQYTGDKAFLELTLLPVCNAVVLFFSLHFPQRDKTNHTIFFPSQSLETWQCPDPSDPTKCDTNAVIYVASLLSTLSTLLRLPPSLVPQQLREAWVDQLAALPPLPVGPCPRASQYTCLLPAERYLDATSNSENVELYTVWPYGLFGLGQEGYDTIMHNYDTRLFPCNDGWCQDIVDAALLGLRNDTAAMILDRSAVQPADGWKFPTFVGPMQDSTPAVDHFSVLRSGVHAMLMQELPSDQFNLAELERQVGPVLCVDRSRVVQRVGGSVIMLFGALPDHDWDVEFKLVATGPTVIEARCVGNTLEALQVTPQERAGDVILVGCKNETGSVWSELARRFATPSAVEAS